MNPRISDIVARLTALEAELEAELGRAQQEFRYHLENRKVRFERDVLAQQKKFRENLARYILTARPKHLLTAPFIYAVFFPMLLLDFFASLYQYVCFPIYDIPRVQRRDHMVYDRHHLAYLNLLEKFNCLYCSYANGLASYLTEIIARTEQYWCPIKHAQRGLTAHSRYSRFTEYGDAESYRRDLKNIRRAFDETQSGLK